MRAAARAAGLLLATFACLAQQAPCPEPGSGPTLDARALEALRDASEGLSIPRGSRVRAAIDRALLCPGAPEQAPCLVQGSLELACVELEEGLSLDGVLIDGHLSLENARARRSGVRLADVDVLGSLTLSGARVEGPLQLERVSVAAELLAPLLVVEEAVRARGVRAVEGATFSGARLGGGLDIAESVFGALDLSSLEAASLRLAQSGVAEELWLERAQLAGPLALEFLGIGGGLYASALDVGGPLTSQGTRVEGSAELGGRVKGDLALGGLQVRGDLEFLALDVIGAGTLTACRIEGGLAADESFFRKGLRLEQGEVAKDVDLLGAGIAGELAFNGVHFGAALYVNEESLDRPLRLSDCTPADPRP